MPRRAASPRVACAFAGACLAILALEACGAGDVVIGDDTAPSLPSNDGDGGGSDDVDATDAPLGPDATPPDGAVPDAKPGSCEAVPGTCQAASTPCKQRDTTGATCAKGGDVCCTTTCPQLSPPSPSFCDGGPIAPKYDADGCIVGYACAPITCAEGGGQCVALSPGSCASNHVGDAKKYSCGGGLGVMCCLP